MADPNYDDSLKQDLVPVVAVLLSTDPGPLFELSVDVLNKAYELASSGMMAPDQIVTIIKSTSDSKEILNKLSAPPPGSSGGGATSGAYQYDEAADLRAGILALIPEAADREEIAPKLGDVTEISKLNLLATLPVYQIKLELGLIEMPSMPSAATSPSETSMPSSTVTSVGNSPSEGSDEAPESGSGGGATPSPDGQAVVAQRDERSKALADQIIDYCRKKKLEANVGEWVEYLESIHPDELERIYKLAKKIKGSDKLLAFMDYVVVTHQIEQIDVDVQHWQGVRVQSGVGAVGGYSAGIPFRRFDKNLVDLSADQIGQFASEGSAILIELRSTDIRTFKEGANDAKDLAFRVQRAIMR